VIVGNLAAEPDKPVADQAALDPERKNEERTAVGVPSDDNRGLYAPVRPDMALPGGQPGEGLERRAVALTLQRLPDRLEGFDLLMNGNKDFGPSGTKTAGNLAVFR